MRTVIFSSLFLVSTLSSLAVNGASTIKSPPEVIHFNRDIRPILSDQCFSCHGPDKNHRKANLQLDTRDGLFATIKGRHPIVPGKPEESEIYKRITSHDPDEVMPQSKAGTTLTPNQIALIKKWIEQGAKWEGHWSFTPPLRPEIPRLKSSWCKNEIDKFILARLEKESLKPSAEADRRTLIRRLSFDLTGLPPTPEEVSSFVHDKDPKAYENLVDRLMASPHFGERMAVVWLDAVRYADTDGFHADNYRSVWPYRDYVISAFNTNMPFNKFTMEQLAGDLLPNATISQKIASTYNHLNRSTEEGGAQPREYLAKYAADRVRTTSTAWMGATLACAECHDHKFDPYTTKDFYSFEAFFADVKEPGVGKSEAVKVPGVEQLAEQQKLDEQIGPVQKVLDTQTPELTASQLKWEETQQAKPIPQFGKWYASVFFLENDFDSAFKKTHGPEEKVDLNDKSEKGKPRWTEHAEWEDGKVHNGHKNKTGAIYLYRTIQAEAPQPLTLSIGSDDGIKIWFNGTEVLSKQVARAAAPDQEKVTIQLQAGENKLLMKVVNGSRDWGFYFNAALEIPENIASILKTEVAKRSEAQRNELAKYHRSIAPELAVPRARLVDLEKQKADLIASYPTTLATLTVEPRVMRVLPRGNWMSDSGEIVQPSVPTFLRNAPTKNERATRLDLANWLVSRNNPLTARVFVNRLWKMFYGTGISKTLDDFGSRGEWPTNPELLDWLAVEFMDSGWDVKHMVKLMLTASTYRQTSNGSEKLIAKDPFNRLYARQSSFRLEAEMVRDNALAISGLLTKKIGGPSVKPYQPVGYWDQLNFPKRTYQNDHEEALYRRGLYTFWCRTFLQPSLLAFDAAAREECTIERVNSNTPLQALALLNDPTYVEAARVLAEQVVLKGGSTPKTRIHWLFNRTLSRKPTAQEFKLLNGLYEKQTERYTTHLEDAVKLVSTGESPVPKDINTRELATWTSVSRVMLNLHETITRY